MEPQFIAVDSEYNDDLVLCFVAYKDGRRHDFDTRTSAQALSDFVGQNGDAIWVAYSVGAEQTAMLRLGITPPSRWLDLMPEVAQITMTHPEFRVVRCTGDDGDEFFVNPRAIGLLEAVRLMCGLPVDPSAKDEMRDLILRNSQWSEAEFAAILDYCASDVEYLLPLQRAVMEFHARHRTPWTLEAAIYRGKTTLNINAMLHRSSGFPVDEEWLKAIYAHRRELIQESAREANRFYRDYPLFQMTEDGAREDRAQCERYARDHNLPWERTERSGALLFKEDYLDTFAKACPSLKPFKETRDLIIQLRRNRWTEGDPAKFQRPLIQDGSVKAVSIPLYTKTGRSQPMVNRGHILNARPFIRTAIKPPKGQVILGADWSQQEIAISLRFFPDARLRAAYETRNAKGKRDIYTALATMAGAIYTGMTDDDRALARQQFKSVQLGLAYGMGARSLGRKLFADLNSASDKLVITLADAEDRALEIFEWHKETFSDYWDGIFEFIEETRFNGWCMSQDQWLYFADEETQTTQLQNIMMQANGATMMHFATNSLAKTKINFLAEHHDAIYVMCPEDEAEDVGGTLKQIMDSASRAVIGNDVTIDVGISRYTNETGYYDPRATSMVKKLNELLEKVYVY